MFPGLYHCTGGLAPNTFDTLTPVMEWVESGVAPARFVAIHVDPNGTAGRTRPVFPYPRVARYDGSGSIDDAANFVPAAGYDAPVRWLGQFRSGTELWCEWNGDRFVCRRGRAAG
jgi:hypothetical protein